MKNPLRNTNLQRLAVKKKESASTRSASENFFPRHELQVKIAKNVRLDTNCKWKIRFASTRTASEKREIFPDRRSYP
jgi:hypothetical protein